MNQIFEIILENIVLISFFLTLKYQVKFNNNKLAWILLMRLLVAYNFYVILTQYNLGRTANILTLIVFILTLILTEVLAKNIKLHKNTSD
jgi:hypothetical protein